MKKHVTLIAALLMLTQSLSSQVNDETLWTPVAEYAIRLTGKRQIIPEKYYAARLNVNDIKEALFSAPHERTVNIRTSPCIITIVDPNGKLVRVRVVESPVMDERLSASFPDFKSFSFLGVDDARYSGKLDWNEFGFHAMVFSPFGDFFIDPYCVGNVIDYMSYFVSDFQKKPEDRAYEVGFLKDSSEQDKEENNGTSTGAQQRPAPPAQCVGMVLRSYRLAVATTGEYAQAATGLSAPTLTQTMAKVQTSVNRVNGVYEKELAIRLVLVASSSLVIYTDPATDSFTGTANNNPGQLIGLSQTIITASVGSANFDIGHTFSTGGGGLAQFAVVCNNSSKAMGITGSANPVGDPYDIDYVAHEIGHQFGGNHTFNAVSSGCAGNRNAATSVEPGSGITVMAYAGLCGGQDLASHSIPYFHAISYDELVNFSNGGGNSCAQLIQISNSPPLITTAGASYYIPKGTPFFLTGSGTDPDGDSLVYSWEETDPGPSGGNWNSGNKPYFRSYVPDTAGHTRYFPNKNVVLSGNYQGTKGEYLPNTPQVMNFRLTGRDKNPVGGGVCYDFSQVIMDTTGPFLVVYPSATGISWASGSQQNIMWDPKYTNLPPISCDSVVIYISYNGGNTYQVLVNSAPNFGMYQINVPVVTNTITTCRIKVQGLNNIFYDISNNNFTIYPANTVLVDEFSNNNPFSLYAWPNPVSSELNIKAFNLNASENTSITIRDVVGKEVYHRSIAGLDKITESADMSEFGAGIYFVTVSNDGRQSVHRIVRQ